MMTLNGIEEEKSIQSRQVKASRNRKRVRMTLKELEEDKSKNAEKERTRWNGKRATMTLKEIEEEKSLQSKQVQASWTRKRSRMTHEQTQKQKLQVASKAEKRKLDIVKHKEDNPKGFVSNDAYFLSEEFLKQETKKSVVSDGRFRDENGCHYLGPMNEVCGYCNGLGFLSEVQGHFTDKNGIKHCHFGELCCNKGKVKGILQYNLPATLKQLYTSQDPRSKHFWTNARLINNAMAMSSLTCNNKWQTRVYKNTCESMLTAQGQLLRRVGPMLPTDDGEPLKCVQAYFVSEDKATHWRMHHSVKNKISSKERNHFECLFKMLHRMLKNDANNKYVKSFLGVKEYVEKECNNKVWDVKLSIHAEQSAEELKQKGKLKSNVPVVKEIAIVMPDSDLLSKNQKR